MGVPSEAEVPKLYLVICKEGDDPSVVGGFTYTIKIVNNDGTVSTQTATVPVGSCSEPQAHEVGTAQSVTVTETSPAATVTAIDVDPSDREISHDFAGREVVFKPDHPPFTTTVTFHNADAPAPQTGVLKVCKVAGDKVPVGKKYNFSVNGGPPFTIPAGPAPGGYCFVVGTFPVGQSVTIQEILPLGDQVSSIAMVSGTLNSIDLANGTANVTIGPGVTEVRFTDKRVGTGFVEICKRFEGTTLGPNTPNTKFTVSGVAGTVDVPPGTCSPPIQVTAGVVTITEMTAWFNVGCSTIPSGALITWDAVSRTATVQVPPGGVASQVIVTFVNKVSKGLEDGPN